ncbi:MAG: pimeloyl-ACP methyl ester esterase BioH [Gammaproteobacteria bacterium]
MSVSVASSGAGEDLVLVHGWGLHGGVFGDAVPLLAQSFRVHVVDLPGHGRSAFDCGPGLRAWAEAVQRAVPDRAAWLGWSLGALLAMRTALDAVERISSLVLVGATPRFTATAGWPHAQPVAVVDRFGRELVANFRKTVQSFLTLQSLGDDHAREQVRAIRPLLFEHGDPDPRGLAAGLAILHDTDLRAELAALSPPTLVIAGARDRLTPPGAAHAIAALAPNARVVITPGAAHAPFLNEPAAFVRQVTEFIHDR